MNGADSDTIINDFKRNIFLKFNIKIYKQPKYGQFYVYLADITYVKGSVLVFLDFIDQLLNEIKDQSDLFKQGF